VTLPLERFGISAADELGRGGEAAIYALDDDRVLRLYHEGAMDDVARRNDLLLRIRAENAAFRYELPEPLDAGVIDDHVFSIERRLSGVSLIEALGKVSLDRRRSLIESYMDAAWDFGTLTLRDGPAFGDLCRDDAITASSGRRYLQRRVAASVAGSDHSTLDTNNLVDQLGEIATNDADVGLVHLDYFAGNVMVTGDRVTAIIDLGYSTVRAHRALTALAAAAYLVPRISPPALDADRTVAIDWLRSRGLANLVDPVTRWLAAFWLFVRDDPAVAAWCAEVLDQDPDDFGSVCTEPHS